MAFQTKPPLQFVMIVRNVKTYVLPNSPSGWEGALIECKRDEKYYGVLRTFTVPMDFVLDGAWILRTEFYQYGLRGDVQLQINELNPDTQQYDQIYIGQVDFSNIKDYGALDGYKFTCNVMPNDLISLINAYEDTSIEIPINVPEAELVQIQGIELSENATLNFNATSDHRSNAFFQISIADNQVNSIYQTVKATGFVQDNSPNFTTTDQWFLGSRVSSNKVNCYGTMGVEVAPNLGSGRYRIAIRRSSDGSIVRTLFDETVLVTSSFQFSWNFFLNGSSGNPSPLADGETLSIYFENFDGNSFKGFKIVNGTMFLSYNTVSPPSTIKVLRPMYVYNYLIQAIYQKQFNGVTYAVQSNILNSAPWNTLCITSGDAFRPGLVDFKYFDQGDPLTSGDYYTVANGEGLTGGTVTYNSVVYFPGNIFVAIPSQPTFTATGGAIVSSGNNPAVIKTNFKDFFQSMNSVLNLGFAEQNSTGVLEPKNYFFQQSLQTVVLDDIKKFQLEPYINYIYNSIVGGYPDQTYDVLSGRLEANSTVQYSTPNNKVKKELNIKSVYRADPYGMEFLRIQAGNSNVTNGDNSVFFVKINQNKEAGQVYYKPEVYPTFNGVDNGYFNFAITPKQNLLRHSDFIAGILDKWEGQIKIAAALKSTALVTTDSNGKVCAESLPIDIGTLGSQLFLPYVATITTDLPVKTLQLLDSFPNGRVDFVVDGNTYYGFVISTGVDPAKNTPREYKLLLTSQNNLLNLIH